MRLEFSVRCTHTEPGLQKNVECEFIENLPGDSGAVFRCPICNREIVISLKVLEE